jgi:hypothetical protein
MCVTGLPPCVGIQIIPWSKGDDSEVPLLYGLSLQLT